MEYFNVYRLAFQLFLKIVLINIVLQLLMIEFNLYWIQNIPNDSLQDIKKIQKCTISSSFTVNLKICQFYASTVLWIQ